MVTGTYRCFTGFGNRGAGTPMVLPFPALLSKIASISLESSSEDEVGTSLLRDVLAAYGYKVSVFLVETKQFDTSASFTGIRLESAFSNGLSGDFGSPACLLEAASRFWSVATS